MRTAPTVDETKRRAGAAIDARRDWLIDVAKTILGTPETGFQEFRTSRLASRKLDELGIPHDTGIAVTGAKGYIPGGRPGPTVAVIGELDSLRVPGHPHADPETGAAHACGHHCQIGMMLGVAVGLGVPEVRDSLSGRVALMAVPAEEFIDVEHRWALRREGRVELLSGKQELIRLGAFDDVDMAMMAHTSAASSDGKFSVGGTSNGHVGKYVSFIGKAAHAGGSPYLGINALQAAMLAINAMNAQRETLKNESAVRLHGILTRGGTAANSVPADVRYEGRVRGNTKEAIDDASVKMDRCVRAGALAMGAKARIVTIPGYLPMRNDETLQDLFGQNAAALVGRSNIVRHPHNRNRGGSTDMGDLSQIMPAIHPYTGAATGSGHSPTYLIDDYVQGVINPAKAMAMTVIDLLYDGGKKAAEVLAKSPPRLSKAEYLKLQADRLSEELYEGR